MATMEGKVTGSSEVKEPMSAEPMSAEVVPVGQKQLAVSPKRDVVKSTAVVKWSASPFPVQFSQLSMNTNLNDAPANWLRSESREEQHLRDLPWQRHHSECSSFGMANCYPELAGEVDVVSDAENIKRLLKIPYETNSHASLMVHRVGRTLLLDNFDIHKHLLRQESDNWCWLRQFFLDNVVKNEEELKYVPRQVKTQALLQNQLMYSKFLYKSLVESSGQKVAMPQVERHHRVSPSPSPFPVVPHFVADRTPAIDNVQFEGEGEFHRQTVWTFEDLRMLIGTDLPVFSVGDHPCVSLRLRDTAQPVNVVTGLDYWLDNLMCNVPEVAMCYHDSGFVQKYELIKTEDIPKLESCHFSPQTVKYVATNILSFLRNSATKEGHTYWLYKCKHSDVVKLYDLTTLCGDSVPNQGVTPFTVPVAMLLYRLARRLRLKPGTHARHVPQIKALLQTSLQLLDDTQNAEVCTSSLYLLSDLYVPDGCLNNEWTDAKCEDASSEQSSEEEDEVDDGGGEGAGEGQEEERQSETSSVSVEDLLNVHNATLFQSSEEEDEVDDGGGEGEEEERQSETSSMSVEDLLNVHNATLFQSSEEEDEVDDGGGEEAGEGEGEGEEEERQSETSSVTVEDLLNVRNATLFQSSEEEDEVDDGGGEEAGEGEGEEEERQSETSSVSVKDLLNVPRGNLHPVRKARLEGISGTPDERCKDGLQCVRKGLSCLERDLQRSVSKAEHSSSIVEEQLTCNAAEAIPLKYEPLHPTQLAAISSKVLVKRGPLVETWHTLTKALLLRKACMAYYVLASEFLSNRQYGCSLKHVRYALHCFEAMATLKPTKKADNRYLLMLLLLTTSEVRHHLALGGNFEEHQRSYNDMSEEDTFILDGAQSIVSLPEMSWVYKWTTQRSENLRLSLRCLDTIRDLGKQQDQTQAVKELMQDVTKRTSAICNELAKVTMAQTETLMQNGSSFGNMESTWKQSMGMFERGLEGFRKVKDTKNEAVVLLNMVRLHKVAAQTFISVMQVDQGQFCGAERRHFEEAFECYRKALQCLSTGPVHQQLRNNILWEFSSTYLNLGMYLQTYPPRSQTQVAKIHQEVADLYRKAVKKCQQMAVEPGDEQWAYCRDRIATLEYNLADLHISSYREQTTPGRQQKVFAQAEGNFKRASDIFLQAGKNYKFLQLQCKRLAFYISHYVDCEETPTPLDSMLALIVDCEHPLLAASASGFPDNDGEKLDAECRDPDTLLDYLLRPTLIALRESLKRATLRKKAEDGQQLKDLYKKSLELQGRLKGDGVDTQAKFTLAAQLIKLIREQYVWCN